MRYGKFIGAGMSRRVYEFTDGKCAKIPITGRVAAGKLQNEAEFNNIKLAEKFGFSCFPKAYSLSRHGLALIVQRCVPMSEQDAHEEGCRILETALGRGKDRWIDAGKTPISVLAFALGAAIRLASEVPTGDAAAKFKRLRETLNRRCENENPGRYTYFFDFDLLEINAILETVMNCTEYGTMTAALRDIVNFTVKTDFNFAIEDLWNNRQWGRISDSSAGNIVILDAGFSKSVQNSGHYTKNRPVREYEKTTPYENSNTFNGVALSEISDPHGNSILHKFFTSKGSEYIMSSGGMSRRIKEAGLADDGLYGWSDKILFTDYATLICVMNTIKQETNSFQPIRVTSDWKSYISLSSINECGQWTQKFKTTLVSPEPKLGLHVLEMSFDGDGVLRTWHPGHDVFYIQEKVR